MAINNKTEAMIAIQLFKDMAKLCRTGKQKALPFDKEKCLEVLMQSNAYKDVVISQYADVVALKFKRRPGYNDRYLYKGGYYNATCYGYSYRENSWLMGVRDATCLSEVIQLFPAFVNSH